MYNSFSTFYVRGYKISNKKRKQMEVRRSSTAKVVVNETSEVWNDLLYLVE
jgi:hypothetical protein